MKDTRRESERKGENWERTEVKKTESEIWKERMRENERKKEGMGEKASV